MSSAHVRGWDIVESGLWATSTCAYFKGMLSRHIVSLFSVFCEDTQGPNYKNIL